MLKSSARSVIRLRGVRHNNLKNFDLDLPLNRLIVITGLSGSGKSSLAFDTLFAEGQRRYIETFSPYARQFFDRMDKPQVDSIEGIPPAIAIEQRNSVRTTRSTVGTMTEICDYMKLLWPQVAQLHCRQCGQPVRKEPPQVIWEVVRGEGRETKGEDGGWRMENGDPARREVLITFNLPLTEKLSLQESLALVAKQGFQRLLVKGEILRIEEAASRITRHASMLTIIQDRLKLSAANRARFIEACEQAYHFGKGKLAIHQVTTLGSNSTLDTRHSTLFSNRLHCAQCDIEYREPSPALFSFNNPMGACPNCRGFGRIISIDYDLAIPDRSRTLAGGAIKPWQTGTGAESQRDLLRMCRHFEIPIDVPFNKLPKKWQDFVIDGEPDYGSDEEHQWPRAWYGVKGYFRWLESKAYKMHVRVLLSRYRAYTTCPACNGKRFQPEALLYGVRRQETGDRRQETGCLTLADFYELPIGAALEFIDSLSPKQERKKNDPIELIVKEVRSRLSYLVEAGLGYLTLDRPTRSLSGGETERVSLTTCLGTCLVNTLFVLDEPSVGLHPRDTAQLVRLLERLRNAGNTVVVVEHEASVMRAADQIVDLGPGHGATGGNVVFQGSYQEILKSVQSLTGQYLSGRKQVPLPERRAMHATGRRVGVLERWADEAHHSEARSLRAVSYKPRDEDSSAWALNDAPASLQRHAHFPAEGNKQSDGPALRLRHITRHNLKDLTVEIPLERFVCVTGVSGSGKTTLVREVLFPLLADKLRSEPATVKASDRLSKSGNGDDDEADSPLATRESTLLEGWEHLGQVVLVDQSILGKTPRSNPAVYIGAFDDVRELFAQSEAAKQRGLNASAFSFNSGQGQCERCRGAGFEKIEMQFLSDVFVRCPDCNGRRYRPHILEVKVGRQETGDRSRETGAGSHASHITHHAALSLSIADLLDSTIDEALEFLAAFPDSRPAKRAREKLALLQEVGLGYLKLGQPINTLSGGESQRLKLVRHLADSFGVHPLGCESKGQDQNALKGGHRTLFLFDEPTTGLHFEDVRLLIAVFQRLVDAGHSVVVIEHNLDLIKCADWIIDLGPEAGDGGGRIVAEGTPEEITCAIESHTGAALREQGTGSWGQGAELKVES